MMIVSCWVRLKWQCEQHHAIAHKSATMTEVCFLTFIGDSFICYLFFDFSSLHLNPVEEQHRVILFCQAVEQPVDFSL